MKSKQLIDKHYKTQTAKFKQLLLASQVLFQLQANTKSNHITNSHIHLMKTNDELEYSYYEVIQFESISTQQMNNSDPLD